MKLIIIFASIFFNGQVQKLEYKGNIFKTEEACYKYIENNHDHIMSTLDTHVNNFYPNGSVIYVDCSDKSRFKDLNETV